MIWLLVLLGCTEGHQARPGVLTVSQEQTSSWIRNFNPFLLTGAARFPTRGGIYEPLAIYDVATGEYVPWLATGWAWSDDLATLTFELRQGVRFSDGTAFTAADVVGTFELMRDHPAADGGGIWKFVRSVRAEGDRRVVFTMSRPYVPGFVDIAQTPIVPVHVWREVDDPIVFANPDPVATGPFTEVVSFEAQTWELGRNSDHWMGEPAVEALRFPAFPTNEQANLALIHGEVDWAGNFVPAIDRIYVARDPDHHHYWFPPLGATIFLYANTAVAPFGDDDVRKALSMAIERDTVIKVAMYGYTHPSDATGLSGAFAGWHDPGIAAEGDWVRFDLDRAGALLDAAGYPVGDDGWRHGPAGRLSMELIVVAGWSDWVRAAQVISRNLEAVGVEVKVKTYDFGAWFERVQRGRYDLAIGWSSERPTPYGFYKGLMSAETVVPVGDNAAYNWHRYGISEVDPLLDRFERTTDPEEQHAIGRELQRLFVARAPAIPLFPSPAWGEYNSARFTGFPDAGDPYARLSPNYQPESLLVLTRIEPREAP